MQGNPCRSLRHASRFESPGIERLEQQGQNDYHQSGPAQEPTGPESGRFHAIRDGGWFDPAERSRSAMRT